MRVRIVIGGLLIVALAAVLWLDRGCGDGWIFWALVAFASVWGLSEVFALLPPIGGPGRLLVVAGALALLLAARGSSATLAVAMIGLPAALLLAALTRPSPEAGVRAIGASLFALVYLGAFPAALVLLRRLPEGWEIAVALLVTVKVGDIGAYFSGRAFGRRKLVPRLSPGKTVEGLCGGLALASIAGWLLLGPAFEVAAFGGVRGLVFGLVAGAAGALGDLVESLLKRARQVKDSGRLLPEFGGILDMIDSPLLAAPVVTLLVAWFG
jgi:phosphatidate cytidylyltransferase